MACFAPMRRALAVPLSVAAFGAAAGCSLNKMAVNKIGDAMAGSSTTFASDNDPELIAAATPFSLKLIESLLAVSPEHRGLLLAAASGFTQYSYAFVQQDADRLENSDVDRAAEARNRARLLYLRGRDYGLRGLQARHPDFTQQLRAQPRTAVRAATVEDVPLLYWTAAGWGAAMALSKDNPEFVADQPLVEALIDRAFELNPNFEDGAIHGFLISYEPSRQGVTGDPNVRARQHFDEAVRLTGGKMASPFVSYAEAVSLAKQDRAEFESMLRMALAINPDAKPEWRLANLVMQRRARWLLSRTDELFLPGGGTASVPAVPIELHATSYALRLP